MTLFRWLRFVSICLPYAECFYGIFYTVEAFECFKTLRRYAEALDTLPFRVSHSGSCLLATVVSVVQRPRSEFLIDSI